MTPDFIQQAVALGPSGFALLLMWFVYKDCSSRLDRKDEAFRKLEEEVRTEISAQLTASTSALHESTKVMERVMDRLRN